MADNIESRIDLNIDVSNALASIKTLQAQISAFHQSIRNSGNAVNQAVSDNLTKNLLNNINATQKFSASLTNVADTTQSFTNALEKNKLSLGQYFKYGAASTQSFGRLFKKEFDTIEKVARDRVKTVQTQFIRMGRDSSGALEAIRVRPLKLDMEQLGTQVAMTAQKQQLFNQLLKQGSTNLLNFGKNTQWAGRQLMVGFTIPLSIMGSMAIKEFDKIERQAIRFKRVYGDAFTTDAETDAAIENMRRLATEFTKYGIEVEKTLELAADVAQMGLRGSELTAQVTEATRLAVLGEVEQQEALKATISVTNAFGVAAEELAGKIDFLNAVENETLTAISDLTIAIPKAGPVVKQLGGDVEDLAFFLTAMKEGGINASEGANALKSGLAKLINPTEKASLMLQGFGINLTQIVEQNAGDIKSTVLQFANALDTLDPLNRARAIEELFGRFQFARISTLFENISREGSQAQKVLELANKSSTELAILSERELKRIEDSPVFKLQKAIEQMQEALAPLGAEFIKIITPLIEFGTKILKSFNNMSDGAKAFVTNIITVLGLIAPVAIMTFGLLANGVANLIKGLNVVRTFFGKLAGAGTGLNQMTQYMTMEQLEATAAAASLGQAHSALTTVFTSERTALDGLVRSYNNAIIAMRQYQSLAAQQRVRPTGGTQTKKYASGILSVPGPKGKGDVIPAMLSPGEAVIPAEEAQKYRGFIQQIISDNVPGFSNGTEDRVNALKKLAPREGRRGRSAATSYSMIKESGQDPEAVFKKLAEAGADGVNAMKLLSEAATKATAGAEQFSQFIDVLDQQIQSAPKTATGDVKSTGQLLKDVRQDAGIVPVNQSGSVRAHLGSGIKLSRKEFERKSSSGELNLPPGELEAIRGSDPSKGINVKSGLYMSGISRSVNAKMTGARGAPTEELLETFDTAAPEMFNESIKNGGGSIDELSQSAAALTAKMRELIAESDKTTFFDTREQADQYNARELAAGKTATAGSMEGIYSQASADLGPEHTKLKKTLKTAASTPYDVRLEGGSQVSIGKKGDVMPEMEAQAEKELKAHAKATADNTGGTFLNTLDKKLGISSPSREMYERGKNIVQGLVQGMQEQYRESTGQAPKSGPPLAKPPKIPGFQDTTPPPVVNPDLAKGKSIGAKFVNKTEAFLENQIRGDGVFAQTKMAQNLNEAFAVNEGEYDEEFMEGAKTLEEAKAARIAKEQLLQQVNDRQMDEEGRLLEEETINLRHEDGSLKTRRELIAEEEALRKRQTQAAKRTERENRRAERKLVAQDRAQKRQARAGKALGVLGTATMVAGMATQMDGAVGQIAQKALPALAGLSAIAPILMALPAPLALLAAAVGAVAFGLYKWNDMMKKAREEGAKLGNALSMSTDKLIKFSEATGQVSSTEERRRRQEDQLSGEDSKARKFGQVFLESDGGKQLLADIATATSSGLGKAESASAAGRQLAMMMAQGLISSGEAASIAAAIGTEINDYNFAADITGNLIELVGPNGEDLTTEPLQVLLGIQRESMEDLQIISDIALKEEEITDNVRQRIKDQRDAAKESRDIAYARGGMDGFVAGLEGWAADAFGFGLIANAVTGTSAGEISDTDPEFIIERNKEQQKLQAAAVQLGINQIQQNQQLLDSLEDQYASKIKQTEQDIKSTTDAEKKLQLEKELQDLYQQRDLDIAALNQKNGQALDQIVKMRDQFDPKVFEDAIGASVLSQYAEDNPLRVIAEDALKQLNALEDSSFKTQIQLQFASGELSTDAVYALLSAQEVNPRVKYRFDVLVDKQGIAAGGQVLDLLVKAGLSDKGITRTIDMLASIEGKEDFDDRLEALAQIANMNKEYGITIDLEAASNAGTFDEVFNAVQALKNQPETMTKQMVIDAAAKDPVTYEGIIANWNTIVGADDVISKSVIIDFRATGDMASINRYLIAQGMSIDTIKQMRQSMGDMAFVGTYSSAAAAYDIAQGRQGYANSQQGEEGQGQGGGQKTDPLANILSKLKEIRNAAINAGGGVTELLRVLGDSAKEMQTFRGVSQKLLATGFTREFIDAVMSMDEGTRATFVSIENGVIEVTEAGRALNKAFGETALGEYQNSIAENVIGIGLQIDAMNKLVAAGVSVQDASEIVKDQNLAIAIASQATAKEVRDLADAFEEQAAAQKELALTTPEGRQSELEAVISEANAFFSAQETFQNQRYEAAVKAYEDANGIVEAQRDLADKEFELDDLSFALDQIAKQEEKVNDEYDKREEAIENIYKANKAVIDQDKEKLDIADALASGDLAAAAKAMRAQTTASLERNKDAQLDNLQRSRELDLAQIRDEQGRSRLDLETSIRDIQDEIAQIQEDKLEPYQREIDLLDRIRQDALKDVQDTGFLGLTQARWAEIANEVDRAKFNVEGYYEALEGRLNAIPGVTVGDDGSISVDSNQIVAPEVSPEPTTTDDTQLAATNPNQSQIDELNRLILITRKRVREGEYDDTAQKQRLMQINMQRIRDVRSLGGVAAAMGGLIPYMRMGGLLPYKAEGGSIFKSLGTDTVPAMLTPGEFVVRRHAVSNFGVDKLRAINSGTYNGESVYNYSVNVNVKSDANPDEIARSVMGQIKRIDSQRIRGNRF